MQVEDAPRGADRAGFSVVIPTYNRAGHIRPCLAPFLLPEAAGIEVILVDDGSTDASEAEARAAIAGSRGADIRYVAQANGGPGRARNTGAGLARHDWVVFLDVDDRWFPWTIRSLRQVLAEAGGSAAMLFWQVVLFQSDSELAGVAEGPLDWELLPGFAAFTRRADGKTMKTWGSCNVAVRRGLLDGCGGFEESIRCAEDVDLFFRLAASGPVAMIREPALMGYRTAGADSLSGNRARVIEGLNFVTEGLRSGRYPDTDGALAALHEKRRLLLARIAFAEGDAREAYRLLLASPGFSARTMGPGTWAKTLMTPLLSLVRPSSYRFGWQRARNG